MPVAARHPLQARRRAGGGHRRSFRHPHRAHRQRRDHRRHRDRVVRPQRYGRASFALISSAPDEIFRLHHGTLDVQVSPLHPGERFRILVGDSEVEVHGTAFTVLAQADQLLDVIVRHGTVSVLHRGEHRTLIAGQSWRAPTRTETAYLPTAPVAPSPAPPSPPPAIRPRSKLSLPRSPAAPATSPTPQRRPEELAYDEAWISMRAGRFNQAASSFARAQLLSPSGPLAEDASFWHPVALARSNQPSLAISAFRS